MIQRITLSPYRDRYRDTCLLVSYPKSKFTYPSNLYVCRWNRPTGPLTMTVSWICDFSAQLLNLWLSAQKLNLWLSSTVIYSVTFKAQSQLVTLKKYWNLLNYISDNLGTISMDTSYRLISTHHLPLQLQWTKMNNRQYSHRLQYLTIFNQYQTFFTKLFHIFLQL